MQNFFNNVYFTKCKKNKKQELLNICNKIILKIEIVKLQKKLNKNNYIEL